VTYSSSIRTARINSANAKHQAALPSAVIAYADREGGAAVRSRKRVGAQNRSSGLEELDPWHICLSLAIYPIDC
jgi:hypothetical protein